MKYRLGLCQIKGSLTKAEAYDIARRAVTEAADAGARLVALPEMWNCPYSSKYFREFSEDRDGPSVRFMSELARANGIWLIGGSVPEADGDKVYNTCYIFSDKGEIVGKHRKAHLFDVDVKGGIRFMESDTLSAGDARTVVSTAFGSVGVAICYDVRFPELFSAMAEDGAKLIVLPAAFNMTTGPAHWELLMRARALDHQIYFAACSCARDLSAPYHAYGHSCVVNPWGEFCAKADSREAVICADIDTTYADEIRAQLPLRAQRRPELYTIPALPS